MSLDKGSSQMNQDIRIAIDRGGTFCDVYATFKHRAPMIFKILSVDDAYEDASTEAIRRVLEVGYGKTISRKQKLDLSGVKWIRMGTTVATNALLERKGARTAFVVTKGFKDCLRIGNQSRPNLFDLTVRKHAMLYETVLEVDERVLLADKHQVDGLEMLRGSSGEKFQILRAPDLAAIRHDLQILHDQGIEAVSVAFLHSSLFPAHEEAVGQVARSIGFSQISLSNQLSKMIRLVPRAHSAVADGYLTPELKHYLQGFNSFESSFINMRPGLLQFMQSDGGLVEASAFTGLHAILSGPAGGVVGYARTCYDSETRVPVIGFDMGGTSTDVSRYDGSFNHIMETTTAGITIQSPQLDINTVAAGGGSILFWENGLLRVGPESAGASPGPACYRKGGPLTITDANLFLGRLLPEHFPKIFGPEENQGLDLDIVRVKFQALADQINRHTTVSKTAEDVALGFVMIATEHMSSAIRTITDSRGHEASKHDLAVFGGAGGQVACDVAKALKIPRILIHRSASILSAFGIAKADPVEERQMPFNGTTEDVDEIQANLGALQESAETALKTRGCDASDLHSIHYLNCRFDGADATIMVKASGEAAEDWAQSFVDEHQQEFGFSLINRAVKVDDLRVRVTATWNDGDSASHATFGQQVADCRAKQHVPSSLKRALVYLPSTKWTEVDVFAVKDLQVGATIAGPASIWDATQTIILTPKAAASILFDKILINIPIDEKAEDTSGSNTTIDPIQLSIFGHRFMDIADQMGRTLQRTSVSVNIKERLDFSCAVFDADGGLVANAPHMPVHLGSMEFAVKWQAAHWNGRLVSGDVLLSNHPVAGGVHLPDFTIIMPIFSDDGRGIIFWTAARGHHADVGGITPGSMPPNSCKLADEGAAILAFQVIKAGVPDEVGLRRLLVDEPANYGVGTRNLRDNISDVWAQIAAANTGASLLKRMVTSYSLEAVHKYMRAIQITSALAIRDLMKDFAKRQNGPVTATDYMDDGTAITLSIDVNRDTGDAVFDFSGTGPQVYGNWNAPPAICHSAVIFALRCLIDSDLPLNKGCLEPIKLIIPEASILRPHPEAAVCGGNVLTSQRIVDVVLKAFEVCGASNGCMANLTFGYDDGDKSMGFYETIAGGSGAGPHWEGCSGTQTHMTNTRITDPEIMERRYPVILRQFALRPNSGGMGQHKGGDGVVREIEFRRAVRCSILSERRVFAPYGMKGGEPASKGVNLWIHPCGDGRERIISLGGKCTVSMHAGDRVKIMTPGGGGYGPCSQKPSLVDSNNSRTFVGTGSLAQRLELQNGL